jgi:Holliday junction resolvase
MAYARRAARTDMNQKSLVNQIRRCGISVAITSGVGDGFPDIVVGHQGVNYLCEIKNPDKSPSERKLSKEEKKWHEKWRGQVAIVETLEDVLNLFKK